MSNLKHKTRGNSNPHGKPRVYFCCHPKDFTKYFETISDEILQKQNCTIWYADASIVRNEDFFIYLKQMQLFIMPITSTLLNCSNEALDVDFQFALQNNIPVLPLMQEPGLEELFNKKCGNLQFLDKNNADITAISYNAKLQKYLESVLIGDELAEKIRAAFDAYVFLSYRKKDRRYAQELMRLIHKNEFCRDIAIWYDEFLTPGENFNDSIKEALKKSGLFVLTVTPNLVNEPNYIMTTEYPMAKQEGKPILPAEIVPTDREQLFEKYADIPGPINAHNEAELSKALLESIKKMAITKNDKSPEHNFFIGLAYLGGVDVEVDFKKALFLITGAADVGLIEAMKKLVDIYERGQGIAVDICTALSWQEKIIKEYNSENPCIPEKDCFEYVTELWKLGDLYTRVGNFTSAIKSYRQMEAVCKKMIDKYHDVTSARFLSVSYVLIGDILKKLDRHADAIKAYLEAKRNFELLVGVCIKTTDGFVFKEENVEFTVASFHDLNVIYERLGKFYLEAEDYEEAERVLTSRTKILETTSSISKSEVLLQALHAAYSDITTLYGRLEKYSDMSVYAQKAYNLGKQLAFSCAEEDIEDIYDYVVKNSCDLIVSVIMNNNTSKINQYFYDFYEYCLNINISEIRIRILTEYIKDLNERCNNIIKLNANESIIELIVLFKDFITVLHNLGIQLYENDQPIDACKLWKSGMEIISPHKLTERTAPVFLAAAFCCEKLAIYFSENDSHQQAFEHIEIADKMLKDILLHDNSNKCILDVCKCYKNLIDILKKIKCSKEILLQYYRNLVLLYQKICSKNEVDEHTVSLSNYYEELSNIYLEQDSIEEFCICVSDTIKYMTLLYVEHPKTRWKNRYFSLCKKTYKVLMNCEKHAQALDTLLKWYDACKKNFDKTQALEDLIDVSYRIDAIFKHYKNFSNYEKVIEYLLLGKDVDERIVQIYPTVDTYCDLSFRYENLGHAHLKINDTVNARFYFEKTILTAKLALDMDASPKAYAALMLGYDDLSIIAEKDEKILLLKKCLELVEILISLDFDLEKHIKYKKSIQEELSSLIGK